MSARELYALIVGEFGISPDYFFEKMTVDEAADFLEGARRRKRALYEALRIGWSLTVSNQEGKSREELFPFPWDKKKKLRRVTKSQREALMRKARAVEAQMQKIKEDVRE